MCNYIAFDSGRFGDGSGGRTFRYDKRDDTFVCSVCDTVTYDALYEFEIPLEASDLTVHADLPLSGTFPARNEEASVASNSGHLETVPVGKRG